MIQKTSIFAIVGGRTTRHPKSKIIFAIYYWLSKNFYQFENVHVFMESIKRQWKAKDGLKWHTHSQYKYNNKLRSFQHISTLVSREKSRININRYLPWYINSTKISLNQSTINSNLSSKSSNRLSTVVYLNGEAEWCWRDIARPNWSKRAISTCNLNT